jgi:hypothetical protein
VSGFDNAGVDKAFCAGTSINRIFCAISVMATLPACGRARPRFTFDEMAKIV